MWYECYNYQGVCVLFDTAQLVVWREVGAEDSGEEAVEAVPVRHPR